MEKKNFRERHVNFVKEIVDEIARLITEKGVNKLSLLENDCPIEIYGENFLLKSISVKTRNDNKYILYLYFDDREDFIVDADFLNIGTDELVSVYEAVCNKLGF